MTLEYYCGIQVFNFTPCPLNVTKVAVDSDAFTWVVELYVISSLCLVGLCGNMVSLIVMQKDKERRQQLILLQALALADTVYLVAASFRYPVKYLASEEIYAYSQLIIFPLLKTGQTIAIWMMVLVTIDRYVFVCKPLRATQIINARSRRCWAIGVFVFGIIFNLPRYFDSCIMQFQSVCTDETLTKLVYKSTFNHALYHDIYRITLYLILLYLAPLTILLVLNSRLVRAINYSRRRHREVTHNHDNGETNATIVLVIIVLVFITCETPELIIKILVMIDRYTSLSFMTNIDRFVQISELLMVINSSINFFVYTTFGRRFRFIMRETFTYKPSTSATTRETVPLQQPQLYRG